MRKLSLSAGQHPSQRLSFAVLFSITLHAFLMFGISFVVPDWKDIPVISQPLEVVLVNSKSRNRPTNASAYAQSNLDGGGNTEDDHRAKTPFPVLGDGQRFIPEQAAKRQRQLEQELRAMGVRPVQFDGFQMVKDDGFPVDNGGLLTDIVTSGFHDHIYSKMIAFDPALDVRWSVGQQIDHVLKVLAVTRQVIASERPALARRINLAGRVALALNWLRAASARRRAPSCPRSFQAARSPRRSPPSAPPGASSPSSRGSSRGARRSIPIPTSAASPSAPRRCSSPPSTPTTT